MGKLVNYSKMSKWEQRAVWAMMEKDYPQLRAVDGISASGIVWLRKLPEGRLQLLTSSDVQTIQECQRYCKKHRVDWENGQPPISAK